MNLLLAEAEVDPGHLEGLNDSVPEIRVALDHLSCLRYFSPACAKVYTNTHYQITGLNPGTKNPELNLIFVAIAQILSIIAKITAFFRISSTFFEQMK